MWLEEVLILVNSSSSAELQRSSNVCSSDFPDDVHRSDRTARRRLASFQARQWAAFLVLFSMKKLIMAALWNRAGHYIFALWFLSSIYLSIYLLFSSHNLSSRRLDVYHTSTVHTWCGLSANLECMAEMCCTQLAENTGWKNRHFGTLTQICWAVSLQLRHVSTIGKKLVKHRYLLHMSS